MANRNHDQGDHASFAHPAGMKMLLIVFFSLVGLTILTVVANDWPLGQFDIVVAMIIATVKASLVGLFFMHMFWDKAFNVIAFMSSILFVTLFICMTLLDRGAYKESMENYPVSKRPPTSDYVDAPVANE